MEGNVVSAAKWLSASMLLSSVILVSGIHLSTSSNADKLGRQFGQAVKQGGGGGNALDV